MSFMATGQRNGVMDRLRRTTMLREEAGLSDGELLECFLEHKEEIALEALVRRHGPMELGVCRRVLGHAQDAEDAFQATFLVLVKKAGSIWPRGQVGNWLYGVAYRTALKAKAMHARRRTREKQVMDTHVPKAEPTEIWHDLQPLLDEELNRLADKYRVPVVLCDLEGKSRRQAAHQLGWPEGTLSTRLTRARQLLAQRLTRRGIALSGGALAVILSQNAVSAAVPLALVGTTVKAATLVAAGSVAGGVLSTQVAALMEGVLQAMFLTKLKNSLLVVLVVGLLGTGVGLFGVRGWNQPTAAAGPLVAWNLADEVTYFTLAGERREEERTAPVHAGKVASVAQDGKSFTLEVPSKERGEEPKKVEIKLTDKTEVTFSGVGVGDAKITEGYLAQVWTSDEAKTTPTKVHFLGKESMRRTPDTAGKITSVSKDGTTLTIEQASRTRGEPGQPIDIKITVSTTQHYSFVPKGGTKPTEGYEAAIWLEKGSKTNAAEIHFRGGEGPERGRAATRPDKYGKVVAVSKEGKVIAFEVPPQERGQEPGRVEIKLDDKTSTGYLNVGPNGDRPTEGYFAQIWLVEGSKDTAANVIFQAVPKERQQNLLGKVVAVAKDGKGITLEVLSRDADAKKEIKITEQTRIVFQGVPVNGARLTEGYRAQVLLEENSTDTAHYIFLSTGEGTRR
jgi:RNA polymerase sigma factor (sigma-70 family)